MDGRSPGTDNPQSFADRLRAAYGEGVDPEISLDRRGEGADGSPPSAASSELLRRLAEHSLKEVRYELEGEIARGGMGAIWRVWDGDLRRHLAMKVILAGKSSQTSLDATPLARFLEEAQVTGQLDHPGIVPVHELGLDGQGRVYFTMKLVKGRDLKAIYDLVFEQKEGWNETRALSVILRACEAMAYAHKKGVIHRDLKPANVMVGNFGEVYVMDWGLARVLGQKDRHDLRIVRDLASSLASVKTERRDEREDTDDSPIMTMDGEVIGTPAYMSPEQARGEIEKLGPRSDVYSMGALLYHLLARRPPYLTPGARISNRTVLGMVIQGPPAKLALLRKEIPAELVAIVEKAMAREAEERYSDTRSFADDLRAYLEHRVVGAYETGTWAETKKWIERNKPLAASLAGAALLLVLGMTVSFIYKTQADESALLASNRAAETAAQQRIAMQMANDVLSLSAIQELKDLEDRADALWPAHPEHLAAYEQWLADAQVLIDGRAADSARNLDRHPGLVDHESKLADLRLRAKRRTAEQVEADRKGSPSFDEWERARAELTWMRRMLGEEPWPSEASVEAELAREELPSDASALNNLAWRLVDTYPARVVYGSELKGLSLAWRAAATDPSEVDPRCTLSFALFRCGRLDEALAEADRAVHEANPSLQERLGVAHAALAGEVALWRPANPAGRSARVAEAAQLSERVLELERAVGVRRTYEFDRVEDGWWHAQLAALVSDLKTCTDEQAGGLFSTGTSNEHGWGIIKRAQFARSIEERSVRGADARKRWSEAIDAIANSEKYRDVKWPGGGRLVPQIGLLPIGEDPDSHLWEFAHLQTGTVPERGSDGKLVLSESMGIVFVLIPGGPFPMGAQFFAPYGQNFDPLGFSHEMPVHEVTLSPYFLSKYEMTQGQWQRFAGRNPSQYAQSSYDPIWNRNGASWSGLLPVEQVNWLDCAKILHRLGLELPSEAQWEYAARAGTSTMYWTGNDPTTLSDAGNVADAYAQAHGAASWSVITELWDDGETVSAPVGTYRANAFGLHDVHGNVWEWCADGYDAGYYARSPLKDPIAPTTGNRLRVIRGGGFVHASTNARSAFRDSKPVENQSDDLGVRPARSVSPR